MPYQHRKLFDKIKDILDSRRALFILGARQVGKTTLLKMVMEHVGEENSVYLDLENTDILQNLSGSIEEVISYITLLLPQKDKRNFVFIDEIQYLNDFSKPIKYLVDHYSERFKLIMTGSSSLLIKKTFKESLVGRKDILELYPLAFSEFCLFRGEPGIAEILDSGTDKSIEQLFAFQPKLNRLLEEFLKYGGYPSVVLQPIRDKKITILKDIVNSYILKDIRNVFTIENVEQFNHLIRYLAVTNGKELNVTSICTETKLHKLTAQNYLLALKESYIIRIITPHFQNLTTELRKMPKMYFVDTGIRNALLNNFNDLELRADKGELLENYVCNQLHHKSRILTEIKYWKTRNGQEVDFVVLDEGKITAYEVKYSREAKNFLTFMNAYPDAVCRTVRFNYQKKAGEIPGWAV